MARPPLTRTRLIICEGGADAALVRELIRVRGIPPFDVRATVDKNRPDRDGAGNTFFGDTLESLAIAIDGKVKEVVIITDADDDADRTLALIAGQLERAKANEPTLSSLPRLEHAYRRHEGAPSLSVYLLPREGEVGNLEGLVYEASSAAHPDGALRVEEFAVKSGVPAWSPGCQAKMRVRSLFSSIHSTKPDVSIGQVWTSPEKTGYLIPLDNGAFDDLDAFLRAIPA